jgi:hypothetical protein
MKSTLVVLAADLVTALVLPKGLIVAAALIAWAFTLDGFKGSEEVVVGG